MSDYRVKFEVFEGPLDLLLYLIRKEEVDIYEVNLTKIATEFIEYLNLMRELDLDVAGEFVVMAATLMLIKSRELLPRDQRPETPSDESEDLEDPRWELIRQLVEYKKFKDAASRLQTLEVQAENTFPRIPGRVELPEDNTPRRTEASIFDLLAAVNAVLKRFGDRAGSARDVFEDKWSVSEKIESLLGSVRERSRLRFSDLFRETTSRTEVVVTFLALLELIRLRMLVATQAEQFADIAIELAPAPEQPTSGHPSEQSQTPSSSAASPAPPDSPADAPAPSESPTTPPTDPPSPPPAADDPTGSRWN
ncbi:MAG: segregation/condensation protein A [Verrucomicrobiales bacterium]|nr:segregation/condensation protein A [Verrucomicrobiales bacterium]